MQVLQFLALTKQLIETLSIMVKQENFREKFKYFMYNDTVGTIDEMRAQLELNFIAKNFKVNVGSKSRKVFIDAMLLIPVPTNLQNLTQDEQIAKGRLYLSKIFSSTSDLSSENLMTELQEEDEDFEKISVDKLAFINQPNAALYELMCYETRLVDLFLDQNVGVLLWNYRGYGRSEGTPKFGNMVKDARKLLKVVKERLNYQELCVYGRSLGGHVAKGLSFEADLVILDRTFSSISKKIT